MLVIVTKHTRPNPITTYAYCRGATTRCKKKKALITDYINITDVSIQRTNMCIYLILVYLDLKKLDQFFGTYKTCIDSTLKRVTN